MMKLMVKKGTQEIHAASDLEGWPVQVPDFCEVVEFPGKAEGYVWPSPLGEAGCVLQGGKLKANLAVKVQPRFTSEQLYAAMVKKGGIPTMEEILAEAGGK
jgi:hypothetical protein